MHKNVRFIREIEKKDKNRSFLLGNMSYFVTFAPPYSIA
ncbi:hypothetical protein M113_2164 [Bacteroides fragilis str. 3986 N3]|uniref:Uncharacterized protein n=5 Tax=Bacteroides fragilis TaxID=817 RepID=A0A015V5M0_BACFG|nr:hypothetical protein M117_2011 [Bacteroides fragilis str. 3774 T13]EXY46528.1 hypothetical protein M118_1930 [Bacteroides fragilis str. 3783N1-2]EXY51310.1 hypothetical protein M121_1872 [Bacteroides fragilis str. 3783N2-1]EXY56112.1 hypothetical protein M122_1824 [Bacteroides fragilis str. 3976T7]EXY65666.1 hypothetical protein M085_1869 [Bacteroides fragilis str. 3986 N(B)19]EXY74396.1 hypothetical protein M124_1822 [Bacteroides fragilis str. 3988T(B)14]EXY84730.1 hypothetical protein M0